MNTILVPVDFSESAADALRYAIELNRRFFAKIVLLYVFDMPKITGGEIIPELEFDLQRFSSGFEEDLDMFFKRYCIPGDCSNYEVHAVAGEHNETIVQFADRINADLIVLGRKGVAGLRRLLFGSVSRYVLTHARMPVIVVPAGTEVKPVDKILLATDFNEEISEANFDMLNQFATVFEARVEILNVFTGEFPLQDEKSSSVFRFLQLQFHQNPHFLKVSRKDEVMHAVAQFAEEHHVNLIVTIPHEHDWFERLTTSGNTEKLLTMLNRPLMTLPHMEPVYTSGRYGDKHTVYSGDRFAM